MEPVQTISRSESTGSVQSDPLDKRSTLYLIPREELKQMHLFSQSSELIPQPIAGELLPHSPSDEESDAGRADQDQNPNQSQNQSQTDLEIARMYGYGRGSYSVHNQLNLASKFAYNAHNESIFDDEHLFPTVHHNAPIVKFDDANPDVINHATLKALVVQLTSPEIIDYLLICDFFLTYRTFVSSIEVMELLLTRLMWSLQYIASQQHDNVKIGKLVLLRTFVVLRHWILNYFVDDFVYDIVNLSTASPSPLCDIFVNMVNQITSESEFVTADMVFEAKIFTDLKIHWLAQVNGFWDARIDLELVGRDGILMFPLPLISTIVPKRSPESDAMVASTAGSGLSKSNTEMSIHTNPSFRRSAMLSLYDQKVHHKCLIYEDGSFDENPQMSINNLLLHHKLSRASINYQLQSIQKKPVYGTGATNSSFSASNLLLQAASTAAVTPATASKRKPLALASQNKHNHINLQDSSVGLKRTTKNQDSNGENDTSGYLANVNVNVNPTNAVDTSNTKVLNNCAVSGGIVGFSTNGNIKLPSSKIEVILPNTPVRKMEYSIRAVDPEEDLKPPAHFAEADDLSRKNSLKKFVDNWKKSFHIPPDVHAQDSPNQHHSATNLDAIQQDVIPNSKEIIGSRVDILSARIIDELEYLIRFYIQQDTTPNTIPEDHNDDLASEHSIDFSPTRQRKLVSASLSNALRRSLTRSHRSAQIHVYSNDVTTDETSEEEQIVQGEELPENNLSDGEVILRLSSNSPGAPELLHSFQRAASINWNDAELEVSEDTKDEMVDDELDDNLDFSVSPTATNVDNSNSDRMKKSTQTNSEYFDVSSEFQGQDQQEFVSMGETEHSFLSSVSTPSNLTQYDQDVTDLGIVLSPQLGYFPQNQQHQKSSTSLTHPRPQKLLIAQLLTHQQQKRISFNEANINYNQKRLSIISRTSSSSIFRRDSVKSYISYDLIFSSSQGSNKGTKKNATNATSTNGNTDEDDANGFLRKKNGYKNLRGVGIGATPTPPNGNASFTDRHSVVSFSSSSVRKSLRYSTLFALTELPFNDYNNSKEDIHRKTVLKTLDVADSSIFSVAMKGKSASSKVASNGSSDRNSAAIPGISNYVLKELAEIPDESFRSNDPVEMALNRLEGSNKKQMEMQFSALDSTQDILDEINQPFTKEVNGIEFYSDDSKTNVSEFQFGTGSPTTPKNLSMNSLDIPTSTPNKHLSSTELPEPARSTLTLQKEEANNSKSDSNSYLNLNGDANEDAISNFNFDSKSNIITTSDSNFKLHSNTNNNSNNCLISNSKSNTNLIAKNEIPIPGPESGSEPHLLERKNASNSNGHAKLSHSQVAIGGLLSPKAILDVYTLSNEVLSVEKVMTLDTHVSFILSYDSREIAEHMTAIEQDILQEIDWKELIELKWNKDLQPVNSWLEIIVNDNYYSQNKGVNLVISRFNLVVNWIISEILLTKSQKERIHIISRFIHIAQNCFALQNFSSLMQIILALTSEKVSKLKETWKNLPPGDILMLKNLEDLASPLKNFLNIRLCINQMTPSKGCIPFVGLYLSDLIFNAERPAFIPQPAQSNSDTSHSHNLTGNSANTFGENEKFINFSRFRTSVHIVKSLSQCIEWSNYYNLPIKNDLLSRCLYIKSLDESEMNYCLQENLNSFEE